MRHRFWTDLLAYVMVAIAIGSGVAIYFFSPSRQNVRLQSSTVDFAFEGPKLPERVTATFQFVNESYQNIEITSGSSLCDCMTPKVPVMLPRLGRADVDVVIETDKMSIPTERKIRFFTNPQIPGLEGIVRFTRVPVAVSYDDAEQSHVVDRDPTSESGRQSILDPTAELKSKNKDH